MQTASIQTESRRWTTWLAFLLIAVFNYELTALGASTERLRQDLAMNRTLVGLHATFFAVGVTVAGLVGSRLSRRYGRRVVVSGGGLGMAAGAMLIVLGRAAPFTLAGALVMGAAGSLMLVLLPALLADLHGSRSGAILAQGNALASLFAAIAPSVVGAAVAIGLGWRTALVLGSLTLVGAVGAFFFATRETVDPTPQTQGAANADARPLPRLYWYWWATLTLAVCVEFSFVFWTADELRSVAAAPAALAAGAVSIFQLALATGRLGGARALPRTGNTLLLRGGLLVTAVGFILFWSARSVGLGLVGLAVAGLGVAMLYPISLAGAIAAAEGRSDLGSARATLGSGVAIGLAPFLLGFIADARGVHVAYLVIPLVLLGAALTSALAGRRRQPATCPITSPVKP